MSKVRIFVSYRRDDTRHIAGRIADHLNWEADIEDVFFDKQSITPGAQFPARIDQALRQATHVLVVMGPQWSTLQLPGAQLPRIFDEQDFVRREVATALSSQATVIPVCVDGATMKDLVNLPPALKPLLDRNAFEIRKDANFADDFAPLVQALTGHPPRGGDTPLSIVGKAVGGAAIGFCVFLLLSLCLTLAGLDREHLFPGSDPQAAQERFALLPWAFTLVGALALPLLRRRWHLGRLRPGGNSR